MVPIHPDSLLWNTDAAVEQHRFLHIMSFLTAFLFNPKIPDRLTIMITFCWVSKVLFQFGNLVDIRTRKLLSFAKLQGINIGQLPHIHLNAISLQDHGKETSQKMWQTIGSQLTKSLILLKKKNIYVTYPLVPNSRTSLHILAIQTFPLHLNLPFGFTFTNLLYLQKCHEPIHTYLL